MASGYDCPFAIATLDDDDIKIIQSHIVNKESQLLSGHSVYSEQSSFELLPGHLKVLSTLKKKAIEFGESRTKSNSQSITEEITLLFEEEIEELKDKLIQKLNTFVGRFTEVLPQNKAKFAKQNIVSIDTYITNNSRSSVRRVVKPAYKCTVKCNLGEKSIPCTFNNHWETSNFEKHLKKHVNQITELEQLLET